MKNIERGYQRKMYLLGNTQPMGKSMRRNLLVVPILFICIGCTKDSALVQPEGSVVTISSVVPERGRMGDPVAIYGAHFDSLRWRYPVSFNGVAVFPED